MADIAQAGDGGSGIITGTPKKADNTGRDWGQGAEIGAATVGSILASIFSFGAAAAPAVAATAALGAATAGIDVAQDNAQNAEQARTLQKQLDQKQAAQPHGPDVRFATPLANPNFQAGKIGSGQAVKSAANPMGTINTGSVGGGGNDFSGFKRPLTPGVDENPDASAAYSQAAAQTDYNNATDRTDQAVGTSDRRAKKNIASGNDAAQDFLSLVRARGAWPKSVKDV